MNRSKEIAVCAVISALSVVLLFLGGMISVFAYAAPMLVGLLIIILRTTFSERSAVITYAAVSVISLVLVGDKECALMYAMFFGYYPIIEERIKQIKVCFFRVLSKFAVFNFALFLCQLILVYVFGIPFLEEGESRYFIILFAVLMNVMFFIYDKSLEYVTRLYQLKFEKYIKRLFK